MLRLLPIGLGVYLSSLATASTRRRVDSSTAPLEFNARETVAVETFALLATSLIVGFMRWTCVSGYMKREKNILQCNRLHCKEFYNSCQVLRVYWFEPPNVAKFSILHDLLDLVV